MLFNRCIQMYRYVIQWYGSYRCILTNRRIEMFRCLGNKKNPFVRIETDCKPIELFRYIDTNRQKIFLCLQCFEEINILFYHPVVHRILHFTPFFFGYDQFSFSELFKMMGDGWLRQIDHIIDIGAIHTILVLVERFEDP
jgi:hypothetical protein